MFSGEFFILRKEEKKKRKNKETHSCDKKCQHRRCRAIALLIILFLFFSFSQQVRVTHVLTCLENSQRLNKPHFPESIFILVHEK